MGHHHHGHAGLRQLLHNLQNLPHHLGVQSGGGLVKEHDLRLHHQGPDDGDSLLLTAGELDGVGIRPVGKTHSLQKPHGLLGGILPADPGDLHGRQNHVLHDGLVGEEVEVLEDHAHFLAVEVDVHLFRLALLVDPGGLGDVNAVEENLAACGDFQQVQAAQQGGLAGAGGADDHHHIPLVDIHADIVQSVDGAFVVVFFQVFHLNQVISCLHGSSSFQSAR